MYTQTDYYARQRELDRENREILNEIRVAELPADRLAIHVKFNHDADRCRCFTLAGVK